MTTKEYPQITPDMVHAYARDKDAKAAAWTLTAARVRAKVYREAMDKITAGILADMKCTDDDGKPVTEPKDAWTLNDDDHAEYVRRKQAAQAAAGYDVPEGYCPALMAEADVTKAENALLDIAAKHLGDYMNAFRTLEIRERQIALALRPFGLD